MSQRSSPSGWQKGMSSCVRFAAIVPATIAVWRTWPLTVAKPADSSARNASAGKRTIASAVAVRRLSALPLTSTIVGAPEGATWESFFASSANVVHLDLAGLRAVAGKPAQLAVAVLAPAPDRADPLADRGVVDAAAQQRAEIRPRRREEAGVEDAVRGKPRARAAAAERLRDGRDESDLARAVRVGIALGDLARVGRCERRDRMDRADRVADLARRHH